MIDRAVAELGEGAARWAALDAGERAELLDRCIPASLAAAPGWVAAAARHKGPPALKSLAGEEWLSGPATTIRGLRLYRDTLRAGGAPEPVARRTAPSGHHVARLFPHGAVESLVYFGAEAEIWVAPGDAPTQGAHYVEGREAPAPGVATVLGAGNIASIGPLDVLHKLIVDNESVALKLNPVNAYLGPSLERALAPLIEIGALRLIEGGAAEGAALCEHPGIRSIHLTGSHRTHDAIVWGASESERAERKAAGTPRLDKRVTSELGCVTPVLLCPGRWSERELDYQALQVASMVTHNASFNCNAGKVLVLARGWPQREAFLARLRATLADCAPRRAYYPGAHDRYAAFLERYPQAEPLGADGEGIVPWTLIPDVPARPDEYALQNEAFCGVLAEVSLDVAAPGEFLELAVPFANKHCWGNLSASLIVDDATREAHADAVDAAIAALEYGSVALNCWPGLAFYLGSPSWGAYPGNPLDDIRSGRGAVHNTSLFDHPQKSVVRTPFRIWPKPPWFAGHGGVGRVGRLMARYEATGESFTLLRLGAAAIGG